MRSLILATLVVSALLFAGCLGPSDDRSWAVGIHIESVNESANHFEIEGVIELQGKSSGVTLNGVMVVYLDHEERILKTERVGSMSNENPVGKVTANFTERPHYIRMKIKSIDGRDPTFVGWRKWSEGEYVGQRIENKSKYTY